MAAVTNVAADGAINSVDVGATTLTPSTIVSTDFSVASSTAESTSLPDFAPISDSTFTWGTMDSQSFCHALNCAYQKVVNWKSNCFRIPSGKFGKRFILELARLFRAAGEGSVLEGIAIKAALTLCSLVLQKPSRTSKDKQHISCLERRLKLWSDGNLDELVLEGRTIQQRLRATKPSHECDSLPEGHFAHSFAKLMFAGNTKAALTLLSDHPRGKCLRLNEFVGSTGKTVRDLLVDKHPPAEPLHTGCLISDSTVPDYHPVIFDDLDGNVVREAALHTSGAAGPSGVDAYGWRRLCSAFGSVSGELCCSIAALARRLCTSFIDPLIVSPLVACRLIALDKNPGVRPIGVGEVVRRIIAKAALSIIRSDIQRAAGPIQLCAGQISGVEAAIHSMRTMFSTDDTEGMLLVDASNAFNSLNRNVALQNIQYICPPFFTLLVNNYRLPAPLYVDGDVLYSNEGTTQGDPLAMPFYALAILPLIQRLPDMVKQTWYADDASACGDLHNLRFWWDQLSQLGPLFGYYPNAKKTWLVVKPQHLELAHHVFSGSNVNITAEGRPYLGAAIGTASYISNYVSQKVNLWIEELTLLSVIAKSQPHAAYSAFTHGIISKWLFIARTIPDVSSCYQPLEVCVRNIFIPAVTGRPPPGDLERDLLALPARVGGLGITNPVHLSSVEFEASTKVTGPLQSLILSQTGVYSEDVRCAQLSLKSAVQRSKSAVMVSSRDALLEQAPPSLKRSLGLASERGASNWLTVLPVQEHGFTLHKTAFHDAVALRYGWDPIRLPDHCPCGVKFSVEHAFSCPRGGFPIIRHNEIRDLTASLLTEVCTEVQVEPTLQPITGEHFDHATLNTEDGARLDISMNGFWGGKCEKSYVDVKVFNPHAPTNRSSAPRSIYRRHENIKKRTYEARIREVEHATFTPLIFSATGGMADQAIVFYKRLASLISEKRNDHYAIVMGWIRCCLSFSLLRSAIRCLRGSRSSSGRFSSRENPLATVDLIQAETGLCPLHSQ